MTRNDGLVYKRIFTSKLEEGFLTLSSDNKMYSPYLLHLADVLEIWQFKLNLCIGQYEEDEINPAKVSHQFAKTQENFKILGGLFENRFIEKDRVLELAVLPSKEELLAKLVGSIAAPPVGLVNVLAGNIKGLINVLTKVKN